MRTMAGNNEGTHVTVKYRRLMMIDSNDCRIHHMTASMTIIDLIIKPRTGRFGVGDHTF